MQRYQYTTAAASFTSSSSSSSTVSPPATILDGNAVASSLLDSLSARVRSHLSSSSLPRRPPGLAVLLATTNRDSVRYVEKKGDTARRVGFTSHIYTFDERTVTAADLLTRIRSLNADPTIDGILMQLPLPPHLRCHESEILESVDSEKDVDGFHSTNMGNLAQCATREREKLSGDQQHSVTQLPITHDKQAAADDTVYHVPCTPKACLELIDT